MMEKQKIVSFNDLEVYQRSYNACVSVIKLIVPLLPDSEKYDLKDQLSRSSKAVPRLIAEGFAKKYQKKGFQKYLFDAMGESNETQVSLSQCKDLYDICIKEPKCTDLIKEYEIIGKQLFRLKEAWDKFSDNV
jgi:four helix bundle protein